MVNAVHGAAGFLDVADVVEPRTEALDDGNADLDAAAAGDRVEHDGPVGGLGDGAVVQEEAFGAGLVIIGSDDEHGVGSGFVGAVSEGNGFAGGVGAGASDDGDAACDSVDDGADDLEVFVVIERGRLAGGPDGDEPVDAGAELGFDQFSEVVVGHFALVEGRDEGGNGAGQGSSLHGRRVVIIPFANKQIVRAPPQPFSRLRHVHHRPKGDFQRSAETRGGQLASDIVINSN